MHALLPFQSPSLHAVPSSQVAMHKFPAGEIFHSFSYFQTEFHQLTDSERLEQKNSSQQTEKLNHTATYLILLIGPKACHSWITTTHREIGYSLRPVLSNLFDPAGRTKHNHEAAGRTSKLKSNHYNFLYIRPNLVYLCDCNPLKSEVVHSICCTRYF